MTSNDNFYPPPHLKDFNIEKRLGTGTYATVYKAISKINNEVSAVKCIKKNSLNKASTENLLREIKILKQIKHDYIVQLKDFQWDENYIYLLMEYCPGGDLSAFIKSRRTIPEKYVRRFVQQIACALKHLHSRGIAHMDLKPQNILLTSVNNPSLKLADFGFAQYMREDKQSRSLRGSPLYMAPEILKCKVYDSKVDLWSVGVILYEVIFGYAPFVSNSLVELEKKILDDVPIHIPTHVMLSETCKDLLRQLLQRNPLQRITFDQFFSHPFVDLDHMASSSSYPKAIELLNKAVKADEKKFYLIAQRYYLQSIEYLIPAIQYEKDQERKQEIREKAKIYLKRAEEIAIFIKPPQTTTTNPTKTDESFKFTFSQLRQSELNPIEQSMSDLGISKIAPIGQVSSQQAASHNIPNTSHDLTMVSSMDNFDSSGKQLNLLKLFNGQTEFQEAIKICMNADEKQANFNNCEAIFKEYESGISKLMPLIKTSKLSKDSEKILKMNINNWLTRAENLKQQFQDKTVKDKKDLEKLIDKSGKSMENNDDEEETNQSLKQCMVQ